jgi:hypothetical protein
MLGFVVLRLDKLTAIPSLLNGTCLASLHLSTSVTLTVWDEQGRSLRHNTNIPSR